MIGTTRRLLAVLAAALFIQCAGCQQLADSGANPSEVACKDVAANLQVCAYATYATFVVVEELAFKVAQEPALSNSARQAIIRADAQAKPVADSLYATLREYERVRVEIAQGKTPEEKLLVITGSLNQWVTQAAPLVRALVDSVNAAAKGNSQR